MRLFITGGSGYLGQHLTPLALASSAFSEIRYTYFQNDPLNHAAGVPLDVRQPTAVANCIADFQPDVIIHTIGSNRGDDLERVIVGGTEHVAQAAGSARLIHLSTDCVFDGKTPPYAETAVPTPINAYGRAKIHAETIVRQHPNHVIVRTSLIYSLRLMDHGTRWMAQALQASRPVTLFANQVRQPVWADSLSRSLLELSTHDFTGILHIAGAQIMS
ncbi:MAG: sugar nucleotide-binding protein, partial [Anaerolineae bacterium]